jgi:putative ABC transport system substrate-binding protein
MMWRRFITLIGGLMIAWPLASYAQQPKQPLKRVGILIASPCPLQPDNLMVRGLADHGWVEGQNIVFECVSTLGRLDQVPTLARARELVSRRPDVLTAEGYWVVRVLKQETTTIPIVMLSTGDPVRNGIITNLARPEGNVTGVAWYSYELIPKRIELLKAIVPYLRRLAFVGSYGAPEYAQRVKESVTIASGKLGFSWQFFEIVVNDYDEIFARLAAEHFDAAYIQTNPLNNKNLTRISQLAVRHLIPTVGEWEGSARSGLLLSYGQSYSRDLMRGAEYIDKILRGAKPSELPVEQATTFLQVINLKTAEVLGLTVPPSLIGRADEVIE